MRNLGKPVELAGRYYDEGADEITFLNITAFRGECTSNLLQPHSLPHLDPRNLS